MSEANALTEPNPKVLIVGDDPSLMHVLTRYCADLGLAIQTAKNGLVAILRASRDRPQLIILDAELPDVDGLRVCEWVLDPKRPPVDVIVLTARTDAPTVERCNSLGAYHVPKGPDTWDRLQSILSEVPTIARRAIPKSARPKIDKDAGVWSRTDHNKVLIVDDDLDLANDLAHRLQKCGAITTTASDGIRGYRLAVKELPNVVITDYAMERGSGHYLIWRLKSTESTKHIPIIVMSDHKRDVSHSVPLSQETEGYGGPEKYFEKPIDVDALFREVTRYCAIHYTPFDATL